MIKLIFTVLCSFFVVIATNCLWVPDAFCGFLLLPHDAQGWTMFTPSLDSRIMYVSADGDDATGQVYGASSFPDPFKPSGEAAFATYDAAYAHARKGYPDWILFRRGDTFKDQLIGRNHINGRSLTEPALIGAYGSSGPSPVLKTPPGTNDKATYAFFASNGPIDYLAIVGIDFYAYTRNPNDPDYLDIDSGNIRDMGFYNRTGSYTSEGVLIEGCKFRYYKGNEASCLNIADGGVLDIQFRRCIFDYNYGGRSALYSYGARNIELYQCVFDHSSWYSQAGSGGLVEADKFSHSVYMQCPVNAVFREVIVMRSSSGGIKHTNYTSNLPTSNFTIDNCLLLDNEFACTTGSGPNTVNSPVTIHWINNVVSNPGRSNPTNRNLALGMTMNSVIGGNISNNLFIHLQPPLSNAQDVFNVSNDGGMKSVSNLIISGNIVYDFPGMSGFYAKDGIVGKNVIFSNNDFQLGPNADYIYKLPSSTGWVFNDNRYYSDKVDGTRFLVGGIKLTNSQWITRTGDNSTFQQTTFPDPTRSIQTYMAHLGLTPTIDEFINHAKDQDRYNWDNRFTAGVVNDWIRKGFMSNPSVMNKISSPVNFVLE